jgi:hypothetical protein
MVLGQFNELASGFEGYDAPSTPRPLLRNRATPRRSFSSPSALLGDDAACQPTHAHSYMHTCRMLLPVVMQM